MALINLTHIGELALETLSQRHMIEIYCYNNDTRPLALDDAAIVSLIKMDRQADNLFTKLKKLHQICTDYAAGNMQPYLDKHLEYCDEEDYPFEPLGALRWLFDSESADDLPVRIEQYGELLSMSKSFVAIRKSKMDALHKFFGNLSWGYADTTESGEIVITPKSEMPAEVVERMDINNEIRQIETEHCLDRYNDFYQQCQRLFTQSLTDSNVVACATGILSLYAPYESKLTGRDE